MSCNAHNGADVTSASCNVSKEEDFTIVHYTLYLWFSQLSEIALEVRIYADEKPTFLKAAWHTGLNFILKGFLHKICFASFLIWSSQNSSLKSFLFYKTVYSLLGSVHIYIFSKVTLRLWIFDWNQLFFNKI